MPGLRKVSTNFGAGELSELMYGRVNLEAYQNGVASLRNFRQLPQGGVKRRPGTVHCATLANVDWQFEEFVFNVEQAYLVGLADGVARVFDDDGAFVVEVTGCPWTAAMIGGLSVAQQGDFMFVAHEDIRTQILKRTGASTFVLEDYAFEKQQNGSTSPVYQPFFKYAQNDVSMRVTWVSYAAGGAWDSKKGYRPGSTVTLVTSDDFFTAGYVGEYLKIGSGQVEITAYTDARTATGVVRTEDMYLKSTLNPIRTEQTSSTVRVFDPFHGYIVGDKVYQSNALTFRNLTDAAVNGEKTITAIDEMGYSYNCGVAADLTTYGGGDGMRTWAQVFQTRDWQEAAFSDVRGWARCVSFEDRRLIFGGSRSAPNRLFESQSDAPYNFDVGTGLDNESIQTGIASEQIAIIQHLVSNGHLQIFTTNGEYYAPGSENKPLTPGTISFKRQSNYGVGSVRPVVFDGSTLFVTRSGNAVREFFYSNDKGGYASPSLTYLAGHLIVSPVRIDASLDQNDQQEANAYVVNGDGTIAVLMFVRKEDVAGWGLWETEGLFKDVCVCNTRVFVVVEREIGGFTSTFLERFDSDHNLDCSIKATGAAATAWPAVAPHLSGHEAHVVSRESENLGAHAVDGTGSITLDTAKDAVEVGLNFSAVLRTLRPEMNLPDGPSVNQKRRIVSVTIDAINALTGTVSGRSVGLRAAGDDLSLAPAAVDRRIVIPMLGWSRDGSVTVTVDDPLPITINSLVKEIQL